MPSPFFRSSLVSFGLSWTLLLVGCAPTLRPGGAACTAPSASLRQGGERHVPAEALPVGLAPAGPLGDRGRRALDEALADLLEKSGATGVTAAVEIAGQGRWSGVSGRASLAPARTVAPEDRFHVGSAGKMFTAAVVMQLVQEGRLALDASIEPWFPGFPGAKVITVRHLLSNTSGVFNFNSAGPVSGEPDELIRGAARHGNLFCPGAYAAYSNTNFLMLGRIIEERTGLPYDAAVTERVIRPLGLRDTKVLRSGETPTVQGHVARRPVERADYTVPFAAGTVTSSAADMVTFLHALLSGRLVNPTAVREMTRTFRPLEGFEEGQAYGLGLMLIEMPGVGPVVWHGGGIDGFRTFVGYSVEERVFVAVVFNDERPAEAGAYRLMQAAVALVP